MGLSYFITRCYHQVDGSKVYDKEYCYNILWKSVHHIFGELHIFGSVARDAYLGSDTGIEFNAYLWENTCEN